MTTKLSIILVAGELFFITVIWLTQIGKKNIEYIILSLIVLFALTHQLIFNTNAEDAYITLRYVDNFVNGKGWVFNDFEKVEGYSNFSWAILVAFIHKLFKTDIPATSRILGVVISIVAILYSYYFVTKRTNQNKQLGLLTALIISCSGSFACYAPSGLENPLFAFLVVLVINFLIQEKWWMTGVIIALLTATRPEGIVFVIPIGFYLLILNKSLASKATSLLKIIAALSAILIPWTIWRYNYYGHLLPNAIASKLGMDIFYQLKSGIIYTGKFFVISFSIAFLAIIPLIKIISDGQILIFFKRNKEILLISTTLIVYIIFYTYSGGDWMPAWRFYSSFIPLFAILIILLWNQTFYKMQESNNAFFVSKWMFLLFLFSSINQVVLARMEMVPLVREWKNQTDGLEKIGKWFYATLPPNTLLAVIPNGILSYYDKLPTIDMIGLTDEHVARKGKKIKKGGMVGHISHDEEYVINKKPDIIAVMNGQGFQDYINTQPPFIGYENVTFKFANYTNPLGSYVNLQVRQDNKTKIIEYLLKNNDVELVVQDK